MEISEVKKVIAKKQIKNWGKDINEPQAKKWAVTPLKRIMAVLMKLLTKV
jgi:hypothetical protein